LKIGEDLLNDFYETEKQGEEELCSEQEKGVNSFAKTTTQFEKNAEHHKVFRKQRRV